MFIGKFFKIYAAYIVVVRKKKNDSGTISFQMFEQFYENNLYFSMSRSYTGVEIFIRK